jgi:steroid 5-alpha reductase family enzyme
MYGEHDRSLAPKLLMTTLHAAGIATAAWLLFGAERLALPWGASLDLAAGDPLRRLLLASAAIVYFVRLLGTSFVLLRRRMAWTEALVVGVWVCVIHTTFAVLGATHPDPPGWGAALGVALYLAGSGINSGAELARHRWKARPENRGHLYTGGLFRYSMHVNYFGDVVLFAGYAALTGRSAAFVIPLIMAGLFAGANIPALDRHLAERYPAEFERYRSRTKRFVPFVY